MMKRVTITLIALFMLFAVANVYSQGKSEGKGQAHQMVYICHNGMIIEVNEASLDAHLAHGDQYAIMDEDGNWICTDCPEPEMETMPPQMTCIDANGEIYTIDPVWSYEDCEWYYPETCNDGTAG